MESGGDMLRMHRQLGTANDNRCSVASRAGDAAGAATSEYAAILGLIVLTVIVCVNVIGSQVTRTVRRTDGSLSTSRGADGAMRSSGSVGAGRSAGVGGAGGAAAEVGSGAAVAPTGSEDGPAGGAESGGINRPEGDGPRVRERNENEPSGGPGPEQVPGIGNGRGSAPDRGGGQ